MKKSQIGRVTSNLSSDGRGTWTTEVYNKEGSLVKKFVGKDSIEVFNEFKTWLKGLPN